jgi:hypothetical protein
MAKLDGSQARVKINEGSDDEILTWVTVDYTDTKQITEVPPDNTTIGTELIDGNIKSCTVSITGNVNQTTAATNGVQLIRDAYKSNTDAGNLISVAIFPDASDATKALKLNMKVMSFTGSLANVTAQPYTAELQSSGNYVDTL